MAADGRESRLRGGLDALKRAGIDVASASVEALEQALAADPTVAVAVAERLGGIVSEDSARLLERIETTADDKLLRREARRALYRLRQKGVATAEPEASAEPAARPRLGGPEPEGYLSISDPRGDRLFWLLKPRTGGGLWQLSTVVNEPGGLREAVLAEVTRKSVRGLREELATRHHLRMVEADWRYCDWIASEGYERARAQGDLPASVAPFPQYRLQMFTTPAAAFAAPTARLGADREARLADSAALLEEAEIASWFLPHDAVAGALERYREIRDSPIVLDRAAQMTRIDEIVHGAVDEAFSAAHGASWQRRLAEASLVFAASGRAPAAARAAAVAEALASGAGRGIPFCEEMVRRSFAEFFAREAEREKEEKATSVLVTPDDIRAEQARARQRPQRR